MKRETLYSALWGALLAFLLSFGSTMCLVTAFDLGVDVGILTVCCIVTTILCAVCYSLPLGLVPVSVGAVLMGYLWQRGSLEASLEALLNRLSRQYNKAYGWGIIRWSFRTADEMEPMILLMLCVFGAVIAMSVCRSVCRGKSALPGILVSLLCCATCFVVTDTVPDILWLYMLLTGLVSVLLTARVRRQDRQQGNRLCLIAVPATALALLVLLAAVPQSTYDGQARAQRLTELFLNADPSQLFMGEGSGGMSGSSVVDLTDVGHRAESKTQIMEVTADFDGTLYLRGKAMNVYSGRSWYDSSNGDGLSWSMLGWPGAQLTQAGTVTIHTRYAHRMLYMPYYIGVSQMRDAESGVINQEQLTEYSYSCLGLQSPSWLAERFSSRNTWSNTLESWTPELLAQFITLPDHVRAWAEPLAREITGDVLNPYLRAQSIADYVRSSADYDTATSRMPAGGKDFVRWFLEKSDTGYCVHFASAAAVLLQASGIPARYVTGYTAQVTAGEEAPVLADQAHAWVEYWLPGFGWTVLEATPAAREHIPGPSTQETTVPVETTQPETDPVTHLPQQTPQQQSGTGSGALLAILAVTAGLAGLLGLIVGQYRLRLWLRKRRLCQGTANEQALLYWQESVRLADLLKKEPDRALFALAQKAKFSQYVLTDGELAQFRHSVENARKELDSRPLYCRVYYRLILAIY